MSEKERSDDRILLLMKTKELPMESVLNSNKTFSKLGNVHQFAVEASAVADVFRIQRNNENNKKRTHQRAHNRKQQKNPANHCVSQLSQNCGHPLAYAYLPVALCGVPFVLFFFRPLFVEHMFIGLMRVN